MSRSLVTMASLAAMAAAFAAGRLTAPRSTDTARVPAGARPGSLIEHDSLVATPQPGPHRGGGRTTAYSFFSTAPQLELVFRKRVLHAGSAIGYHPQREDEIYYVLGGTGEYVLDDVRHVVGPGTAMLTRPGSSHGIRPMGGEDLVLLVAYATTPAAAR